MKLEEIEEKIKRKSNNKCIFCHRKMDQCYVLEEEKGITEDNMVPLCYLCAQEYLGNPDLIKQMKQMRNYWYEQVQRAVEQTGNTDILLTREEQETHKLNSNTIAIYHVVYENERMAKSAKTIYELLYSAQQEQENYNRILYLDIDGHTDEYGRFDDEMMELQQNFIIGTLLPYFYEIHTPIIDVKNTESQKNTIPKEMIFFSNQRDVVKYFTEQMTSGGYYLEKLEKTYYKDNKVILYKKMRSSHRANDIL